MNNTCYSTRKGKSDNRSPPSLRPHHFFHVAFISRKLYIRGKRICKASRLFTLSESDTETWPRDGIREHGAKPCPRLDPVIKPKPKLRPLYRIKRLGRPATALTG